MEHSNKKGNLKKNIIVEFIEQYIHWGPVFYSGSFHQKIMSIGGCGNSGKFFDCILVNVVFSCEMALRFFLSEIMDKRGLANRIFRANRYAKIRGRKNAPNHAATA